MHQVLIPETSYSTAVTLCLALDVADKHSCTWLVTNARSCLGAWMVLDDHLWFHAWGDGSTAPVHDWLLTAATRWILRTLPEVSDHCFVGVWASTLRPYMVGSCICSICYSVFDFTWIWPIYFGHSFYISKTGMGFCIWIFWLNFSVFVGGLTVLQACHMNMFMCYKLRACHINTFMCYKLWRTWKLLTDILVQDRFQSMNVYSFFNFPPKPVLMF